MQIKIKIEDFYREEYRDKEFEGEIRKALAPLGDVVISEEPDFLFCSCFGRKALKYDCTRILFIGENLRPDFNLYDYAIGNDWLEYEDRFLRLPWYNFPGKRKPNTWKALEKHLVSDEELDARQKFCSFVVSNYGANPGREQAFEALNAYKRVESGGRSKNNQPDGKPVADKLEFLRQCRFNIAIENARTAGYCTEKIVDAFAAATVPIYWGDPAVERIYNPEAFINCNDCENAQQIVEKVRAVEENPDRWRYMLRQPAFLHPDQVRKELEEDPLAEFIRYIVAQGPEKSRRRSPDFWQKNNEDKERQLARLAGMWWFKYYAKGERYLWRRARKSYRR